MRILLLNQFFWPDTAATGQLLSDVAEHLQSTGENVSVICGSANYGGATAAPPPNVNIIRLKTSAFSRKFTGRMGSYISFLMGAFWLAMSTERPDVVVTLTTPPLLSLVGLMIQKLRGARHVIWEMDVYPDVAVDLGVMKASSPSTKLLGWLADRPRMQADQVIVLGECMKARLLAHGVPADKITIVENWAEASGVSSPDNKHVAVSQPEKLSVLYSGNFGLAHDVETIAQAMVELNSSSKEQIKFVFAGGGSRQAWLKDFCRERNLQNAEFLPYCDREELGKRLASGHIGLVTQKNECLGSAVPSKTYGVMAARRPVLFIGPKESTPARVIERHGCGWQVDCGDSHGLVQLLHCLGQNPQLHIDAGLRAHRAFMKHYQRSAGVLQIAGALGLQPLPARQKVVRMRKATRAAARQSEASRI